jgi:hypothetical protein
MNSLIIGHRKTFIYLETCDGESSGCSLVLRGASSEVLKIVKQVVDLMVFVVYSLKLETSLLQDEFALTPKVYQGAESILEIKQISDPIQRALKVLIINPSYLKTQSFQVHLWSDFQFLIYYLKSKPKNRCY